MIRRGRKSAASLSIVADAPAPVVREHRAEAPPELTARQSEIWRATVATEAASFFNTEALCALLADYCRHREASEKISSIIDDFRAEWLKNEDGAVRFKELLKMRADETRASVGIATKLRLTNQSRYTPQAAATAARHLSPTAKPWES